MRKYHIIQASTLIDADWPELIVEHLIGSNDNLANRILELLSIVDLGAKQSVKMCKLMPRRTQRIIRCHNRRAHLFIKDAATWAGQVKCPYCHHWCAPSYDVEPCCTYCNSIIDSNPYTKANN